LKLLVISLVGGFYLDLSKDEGDDHQDRYEPIGAAFYTNGTTAYIIREGTGAFHNSQSMEETNVETFRRPLNPVACRNSSGRGATAHSGGAATAELHRYHERGWQMARKPDNPCQQQQQGMHPELQVYRRALPKAECSVRIHRAAYA
jgi:hypothetical protein